MGGQDVSFEIPEEMVQAFKLKGLQFGHYGTPSFSTSA
jgi:hypothetical protein